jgi:5-methylcytosine-specific restriction endonuclease McrA
MKPYKVLILNKFYFPLAVEGIEKTFGNIFSGSVIPLDISYEMTDDNTVNLENIEYFMPIPKVKEWLELPIRPFDEYIQTARGPIRIPSVVICSKFDKVIHNKIQFPTKQNILKRDNYTCVYTGVKLGKDNVSVDHIVPKSRGGKDTWENMVCCDRLLNSKKASFTPGQVGLKLRYKPYKPTNGMALDLYKDEWASFLKNF